MMTAEPVQIVDHRHDHDPWSKMPRSLYLADIHAPRRTLAVYCYLDEHAGSRAFWITTQGQIAADLGCSRQAVNEALRFLEDEQYLISEAVEQRRTRYEVSARATGQGRDLSARATLPVGSGDRSRDRTSYRSKTSSQTSVTHTAGSKSAAWLTPEQVEQRIRDWGVQREMTL